MSDRRLVAALGKMASDNEHERAIGLKAATALLEKRGVSWPQVAEMITGKTLAEMTAPASRKAPPRGRGAGRPASATSQAPPSRPGRLDRADIPARITGKVKILEETAEGLVIEMMGSGWWGPMLARHATQQSSLRIAADRRNPRSATVITAYGSGAPMAEVIDVRVIFPGT